MKQKAIYLMLLLAAVVTFSACSSDDDDKAKNPLVGTWVYTSNEADTVEVTFNADGTFVAMSTETWPSETLKYRTTGVYAVSGDQLKIEPAKAEELDNETGKWVEDPDDENLAFTLTFAVKGNTLELTYTIDNGKATMIFKKK